MDLTALLTMGNLFTLMMLVFLQAVLGFDNLLYISLESKRVPEDKQRLVRQIGISIAIVLRLVLLFVVLKAVELFEAPFAKFHSVGIFEGDFNVHSAIVLAGGVFIMYTAVKEIMHMLSMEHLGEHAGTAPAPQRSVGMSIFWIVLMNLVFSFDSILSAMALTHVFEVMALAIIISGVMMIVLADQVSEFLKRNRMYEVLGLFILLLVGVMLVSEGAHLAHMYILGHEIEPLEKQTFYFVLAILVLVDVAQGRYQKKLDAERGAEQSAAH